jgi:acetyl-CoA carboxylase beta subunit
VILLAESGGVRLQEANAGLIAVSELMRAVLAVRAAGIPVIVLNGGRHGCFGGMGIVANCADTLVMSTEARLGMSGPESLKLCMVLRNLTPEIVRWYGKSAVANIAIVVVIVRCWWRIRLPHLKQRRRRQ